jgi:hypothetical protein
VEPSLDFARPLIDHAFASKSLRGSSEQPHMDGHAPATLFGQEMGDGERPPIKRSLIDLSLEAK